MKCRILSSTLLFRAVILTVKLKERKNKKYEKKGRSAAFNTVPLRYIRI